MIRHNDWTNARPGWHGTEGGKSRGTRCAEIYNNTSHWTIAPTASYRSGNALIHDNTWDGHDVSRGLIMVVLFYFGHSEPAGHVGVYYILLMADLRGTLMTRRVTGRMFKAMPPTCSPQVVQALRLPVGP